MLHRLLAEGGREVVAQVGEDLRRRLDDVLVVAVALFGIVARAAVIRALGLLRLPD